jgi:hypothetical protein
MERNDLSLLTESYEEVKFKSIILGLVEEGKTREEIEQILAEAGILSRLKGKWDEYTGKGSLGKIGSSLIGKGARAIGDKAGSLVDKGSTLARRGLDKVGSTLGIDPEAIQSSSAYQKLGSLGDKVQQKTHELSDKGYEAESSMRGDRFSSLVDSHQRDIEALFRDVVEQKTSIVSHLNDMIDQIVDDYSKIGGLSRISQLKETLHSNLMQKFLSRPLYALTDPKQLAIDFADDVKEFINKQKTSGSESMGLRKAHKLS